MARDCRRWRCLHRSPAAANLPSFRGAAALSGRWERTSKRSRILALGPIPRPSARPPNAIGLAHDRFQALGSGLIGDLCHAAQQRMSLADRQCLAQEVSLGIVTIVLLQEHQLREVLDT